MTGRSTTTGDTTTTEKFYDRGDKAERAFCCSFVAGSAAGKTPADPVQQLIANGPIGFELLLAAAFRVGRIDRRPIF
jgi:hypothetical protein